MIKRIKFIRELVNDVMVDYPIVSVALLLSMIFCLWVTFPTTVSAIFTARYLGDGSVKALFLLLRAAVELLLAIKAVSAIWAAIANARDLELERKERREAVLERIRENE